MIFKKYKSIFSVLLAISLVVSPLPRLSQEAQAVAVVDDVAIGVVEGVFLSIALGAAIAAICHGATTNDAIQVGLQKIVELNKKMYALAASVLEPILIHVRTELTHKFKDAAESCSMPQILAAHHFQSSKETELSLGFNQLMNTPLMIDFNQTLTGLFTRYGVNVPTLPWSKTQIDQIDLQMNVLLQNKTFTKEFIAINHLYDSQMDEGVSATLVKTKLSFRNHIKNTFHCFKDPRTLLLSIGNLGHLIYYSFFIYALILNFKMSQKDGNPVGFLFMAFITRLVFMGWKDDRSFGFKTIANCVANADLNYLSLNQFKARYTAAGTVFSLLAWGELSKRKTAINKFIKERKENLFK